MRQQQQQQQQSVPSLLREIRECRRATCLAAMRDLRRLSGRSAPAGGFGRRISLAAAAGTEGLLDGAAELLPGRLSSRSALEDLLAEAARRRIGAGAVDREEAARKRRCLAELEPRYCRLLLDEELSLRRLAEELGRRRPEACAKLVAEPAFQECLRRSQLRVDHDRPPPSSQSSQSAGGGGGGESFLQRLLRGASHVAESAELTMNLDACLSVGVEMYGQLARVCRQLELLSSAAPAFERDLQPLSAGQLQPALAWWIERAVYAQDRREVEREFKGD